MAAAVSSSTSAPVLRSFGRYELRQLLGKSAATMVWLAFDPQRGQELMLTLPRVQPPDAQAQEHWHASVRTGARLNHPNLAPVVEVGVQEQWPFVAVDRAHGVTLAEWLASHPTSAPADVVEWLLQALQGLAFAHEAGAVHFDLQPQSLLITETGHVRLMALGAAGEPARRADEATRTASERGMPLDPRSLQAQRAEAVRDLLACGVLLHSLLAGQSALDEPDVARVIEQMPPHGHEVVRLPWTTPHPIPDALRAIVNRCTSSQERQRYHSARTLLRALDGWRQAQESEAGGPLALLLDRLHTVGHLPALPGLGDRVANMTSLEGQHADEMAEQVLQDMALSLELLRLVNSAQVRGAMIAGAGPVLAIRRSIALLGVDGVRRAANALRRWPGPLQPADAAALQRMFDHVRLAGFAAQALRPAGYDPEVVYLIVVLQNLGRLLVQYHFPEEAEQIRQLMLPAPPPANAEPGTPDLPGMSEEAASHAVLGVDVDSLRTAVARHWGLGEEVQHMIRRLPTGKAVRTPDGDLDMLRVTASAGNELADAARLLPPQRAAAAVAQVAQRYARVLGITPRDVRSALQDARAALRSGSPVAATTHVPGQPEPAMVDPIAAPAGSA
jgi:eukaryotic-like serine/threonine-protein kinase